MTIIVLVAIIAIVVLWFISVQRKLVVMDEKTADSSTAGIDAMFRNRFCQKQCIRN